MYRCAPCWLCLVAVLGCAPTSPREVPLLHRTDEAFARYSQPPTSRRTRGAVDAPRPTRDRPGAKNELRLIQAEEVVPAPPPAASADAAWSGEAAAPAAWNLEQLTNLALAENPILRRAQARIDEARGAALQAGLWANPHWDTNNPQVLGLGSNNAYNAGFQTEIPVMGKKRLDREAAEQQIRQAIFAARSDRYDVLQVVRAQFYAVLTQQQRVELLGRLRQIAAGARDAAQRMYDTELVPETDVLLLTVELERAESELLQAATRLIGRRRTLAAAVGQPDLAIGTLRGDLFGSPPRFDDQYVSDYVASQNVNVLSAQTEVDRRRIMLRRAEVEPIPNLYSGPAQQWGVPSHSSNNQFWYNFAFNITLWDRNQGNIRSARAAISDAVAGVATTQYKLLKRAADVLGRHHAAWQRAEKMRREVLPTAERNQELVQRGYRSGLIPVSQVFQAQRSLFEANLRYLDAWEEVWATAAELSNLLQMERFP